HRSVAWRSPKGRRAARRHTRPRRERADHANCFATLFVRLLFLELRCFVPGFVAVVFLALVFALVFLAFAFFALGFFVLVFLVRFFFRPLFFATIFFPNTTALCTASIDCLSCVSRLLGALTRWTRFLISFATFFKVVSSSSRSGMSFIGGLPLVEFAALLWRMAANQAISGLVGLSWRVVERQAGEGSRGMEAGRCLWHSAAPSMTARCL